MGPGNLQPGSYDPTRLTQEQRNWLWNYFGHQGQAPVGYGGENPIQAGPTANVPQASPYPSTGQNLPATPTTTGDYPVYEQYVKSPKEYLTQVRQGELGKQLETFYNQVLEFAKGDLSLAKRIINYTYESGMREAKTDFELEQRRMGVEFPEEKRQLETGLNRRGLLGGGYTGIAGGERTRQLENQAIRREAVDRALKQREENLVRTKEFGTEKEQLGYERGFQDITQRKEQDYYKLAQEQAGLAAQKYQAAVGQKQFEEQKATARESLDLQRKMAG